MNKPTCTECKEECNGIEETHDAPASHCNNGISSIHHTGVYMSDCCDAELEGE